MEERICETEVWNKRLTDGVIYAEIEDGDCDEVMRSR